MTNAFLQGIGNQSSGGADTFDQTFADEVTAGSLLLAGIASNASGIAWTVVDSLGHTWDAVATAGTDSVSMFMRKNAPAGPLTVTASKVHTSDVIALTIMEFAIPNPALGATGAVANANNAIALPTSPGDLMVVYAAGSLTADAGFGHVYDGSGEAFEYLLSSPGGTTTCTSSGVDAQVAAVFSPVLDVIEQAIKIKVGDSIAGEAGTVDAVYRSLEEGVIEVHFSDGHTRRWENSQTVGN